MTSTNPASQSEEEGPLLRVEDLAVSFDNRSGPRIQALNGVRMSIYQGQTLAVVGESGCGKSVTAMSALRLISTPPGRYDRGRIIWRGHGAAQDLLALDERRMRSIRGNEIAMIFQEPMTSLNPVYTVGEQIMEAVLLHQRVSKREAREISIRAMTDVGIPNAERRALAYPHQFSGGMRQRVMIAMALACRPRLLLADEPTTALDVTVQAQILELLASLKQSRSMAIMLITHDMGIVAENADAVCVMYAGRIVEYAGVEAIFREPLHPYTRGLLASIPRMGHRLDRLITIREVTENPDEFTRLPDSEQGVRPWWPLHNPPEGLALSNSPTDDYSLIEVNPEHWVGLWRTPAVAGRNARHPDLNVRRAPDSIPV